ncbi:hypothetical protein H5410_026902 [Solanum commersonii]|uniref:Uncharacterized protein n=1 Tax=Solanum commersonii TaxID=4109 RepID=A0A9J5YYD0_SOLCO|nr:hypothetical protein H5410_026902 [Solanum commersonii]
MFTLPTGMTCVKDEDEDDLYKIYDQFKELSLNVIDNDQVLELLQSIKDPDIRAQIIDKNSSTCTTKNKDHIPEEIPTKEGSYTMTEVKNLLFERRKLISSPTTISDLKKEIDNLKEDIIRLKEKNVLIEVRLDAIQTRQELENASKSSSSIEGENDSLDSIKNLYLKNNKSDFLYSLKAFTSQKFYTKITLLIDYNYKKEFIALIDSVADLHCIQEGLIPSRYFYKTTHSLRSANGSKMNIKFKLPKAFICKGKDCVPHNFVLVKNITNQIITQSIEKSI